MLLLTIAGRGYMSIQPKDNQKTRFGEEGQGRLVESRVYNRGHIMRVKSPHKINKKSASKKVNGTTKREQTITTAMSAETQQCKT